MQALGLRNLGYYNTAFLLLLLIILATLVREYAPIFTREKNFSPTSAELIAPSEKRFTLPPRPRETVKLPRVLLPEDVERYKKLFALQAKAEWNKADALIAELNDVVLMGHVLAQRYMHLSYPATVEELVEWLETFPDHPQAKDIYPVALRKNARYTKAFVAPPKEDYLWGYGDDNGLSAGIFSQHQEKIRGGSRSRARELWRRLGDLVDAGRVSQALETLENEKSGGLLEPLEYDTALWGIASAYYFYYNDEKALETAEKAAKRSGSRLPGMHWTAGLAAWRMGKMEQAAQHFAAHAHATTTNKWDFASGAYWAYRASKALGNETEAFRYLKLAASEPRTFYGILAKRMLGEPLQLEREDPMLARLDIRTALDIPVARRALALIELGKESEAKREFRNYFPRASESTAPRLLRLAQILELPAVQLRMGIVLAERTPGRSYDFAAYPLAWWEPAGGYSVDPALLLAFIRQESGFNEMAESHAGAKGLMQLMPLTAKLMAKGLPAGQEKKDIFTPEYNIALGQAYADQLLRTPAIAGNLFFTVAGYNAGPTKLGGWLKEVKFGEDPLLFIESIPTRETRNYIEQVMANYWIYRRLLGQDTPSLDAVLKGGWPNYFADTGELETLEEASQ